MKHAAVRVRKMTAAVTLMSFIFFVLPPLSSPAAGSAFSVPAWSQPGTRRESIEVNKSSKLSCFLCRTKDTKGGGKNKTLWCVLKPKNAGQVDLK